MKLLDDTRPSPVLDGLRSRWRTAKPSDLDGLVSEISLWQQALWKFNSVGHIGKLDGPRSWMEAVNPLVEQQEFRLQLTPVAGSNEVTVISQRTMPEMERMEISCCGASRNLSLPAVRLFRLRDVRPLIDALSTGGSGSSRPRRKPDGGRGRATCRRNQCNRHRPPHRVDPEDLKAWFGYLGYRSRSDFKLDLLTTKIEKNGAYDFIQGWGTSKLPMLLANSSNEQFVYRAA